MIVFLTFLAATYINSIMYQVLDDSVICYDANYENHFVSNNGYETVVCSYSTSKSSEFMVFLIPPATVSNTVSCLYYGVKHKMCPTPWRIESDRRFLTEMDNFSIEKFIELQPD